MDRGKFYTLMIFMLMILGLMVILSQGAKIQFEQINIQKQKRIMLEEGIYVEEHISDYRG